jgi:hypothetical protein
MSNDLRGQFIANTFQNLMQKPDLSKEEYFNGLGHQITVINRDAIGTIKMFYPIGATLSAFFDESTGRGLDGTEWEGWALCDGRNGGPDLRGRFVAAAVVGNAGISPINPEAAKQDIPGWSTPGFATGATYGVITREYLPPHAHKYSWFSPDDGGWGGGNAHNDEADGWPDGWPNQDSDNNHIGAYMSWLGTNADGTGFVRGERGGQDSWYHPGDLGDHSGGAGPANTYAFTSNTLDGTSNVNSYLELQSNAQLYNPPTTILAFAIRVS